MEIVSFKIAQKLKEKGFYYKCFATYDKDGMLGYNYVQPEKTCAIGFDDCLCANNIENNGCIDAPSISQVLKWFRAEKQIDAGATWDNSECKWIAYASEMNMPDLVGLYTMHTYYNSWEEASLAIIEYVLDNLI